MSFRIQISNPAFHESIDDFSDNLEEAIEEIFPMDTEDAVIHWNGILVAVNYKYDVSVICEDIIDMLEILVDNEKGELTIEWPSNTLRATWYLSWEGDVLKCTTNWKSVSGNIEKLLNSVDSVSLVKDDFISEWGTLIKRITEYLLKVGYTSANLIGLNRILKLNEKIPTVGMLYRNRTRVGPR